jgi:hypothetical protein
MKNDLSERIKTCVAIESGIADIYHSFARLFPKAKTFWYELAMEEENHASVLLIGSRYVKLGILPNYIVPKSLHKMNSTLQLIDYTKKRIKSDDISMKEALDTAMKLELTMEESYLLEVLTRETNNEVIARLQKLLGDTKLHITKISEYMQKKGYK